ncbi:MAG: hypothetical protein MJE68_10910 [Proteobacteria bacterium]|nr:hypothetical protein [Pseudomonadota bacterium]
MPKQFSVILSSCEQIIGTGQNCKLIQYEVTPKEDGTFAVEEQYELNQPHGLKSKTYVNFRDTSFIYVCQDKDENHSIVNLFTTVQRLNPMDSMDDTVSSVATSYRSTDSVPDLVELD